MKEVVFLLFILLSFPVWGQCTGEKEVMSVPDPVNESTFNIEMKVFRPLTNGELFPVVFILPPIVGETPLDSGLAVGLCLNKIGAYVLNLRNDPPLDEQIRNLNVHEDSLIRAEYGIGLLIEKLSSDPGVSGRFGIIGASLGGILSAYVAGVEPSLQGAVLIAAGGDIPSILANSNQETVKVLREKRMDAFSLKSREEYESLIRPFVTREPLLFAGSVPSALVYILTLDTAVPTINQRELANALRSAKVREITNIHIPGIIEVATAHADEIIIYFKNLLR